MYTQKKSVQALAITSFIIAGLLFILGTVDNIRSLENMIRYRAYYEMGIQVPRFLMSVLAHAANVISAVLLGVFFLNIRNRMTGLASFVARLCSAFLAFLSMFVLYAVNIRWVQISFSVVLVWLIETGMIVVTSLYVLDFATKHKTLNIGITAACLHAAVFLISGAQTFFNFIGNLNNTLVYNSENRFQLALRLAASLFSWTVSAVLIVIIMVYYFVYAKENREYWNMPEGRLDNSKKTL